MSSNLQLAKGSEIDVAQAGRPNAVALDTVRSFTGTAAASSAIPDGVVLVRAVATAACHFRINAKGTTTAATSDNAYLPAGVIEYWRVEPGDTVSVIQSASGGNLHLTAIK